jgi:negative regulator of sigma E activity
MGTAVMFLAVLVIAPHYSPFSTSQEMVTPPTLAEIPVTDQKVIFTTAENNEGINAPSRRQTQLNSYLVNHSEYLAGSGMGNVVPFIHVVSYGE